MSQTGTSAWWADVQYLRDAAERTDEARRRADRAELAARRANRDRRRVDAETAPVPRRLRDELDQLPPRRHRDELDQLPPRRHRDELDRPPPSRHDPADAAPHRGASAAAAPPPGRRTIEIHGRTVPAPAVPRTFDVDRRRPPRRAVERVGPRPDRLAMWALLMGLVLILVAVTTADAATVAAVAGH
jgi:hypothetical protein